MSVTNHREEFLIYRLSELAAEHTGFSTEAISRESIARLVREQLKRGRTFEQLFALCNQPNEELFELLRQSVLVGETFFFRHPEHFRFIASDALPELKPTRNGSLRAWSAGCSSGEEAYSLAACLLNQQLIAGWKIEVVGTDLSEQRLALARAGVYSAWSRRESGPMLFPIFQQLENNRVRVLDEVRTITRFSRHNLLDPPDDLGQFDIVFCRNVLVYFTRPTADLVRRHLARALAPGGYLVFGTMDVHRAPPGLVQIGQHGSQIFVRPMRSLDATSAPEASAPRASWPVPPASPPPAPQSAVRSSPPARVAPVAPAPPPEPARAAPPAPAPHPEPARAQAPSTRPEAVPAPADPWRECIALHMEALSLIERGQDKEAARALAELTHRAPDYLPGILELALLHDRSGQQSHAHALMREVLRRADELPPEQLLPGPEPLPVIFYGTSARAFFDRHGGTREG